jgi:diguanylate cyclase (GGDEF)-like protein
VGRFASRHRYVAAAGVSLAAISLALVWPSRVDIAFAGVVALITLAVLAKEAHGNDERTTLYGHVAAVQHAIGTADPDLDAVMSTVVDEAQLLTRAAAAVIEIPDGDELVYRAVSGTAAEFLGLRLPSAETISGLAIRTGQTLISDDTELDIRVDLEACRRTGARSLVVVPLFHGDRAGGVLKVYSGQPSAFGTDDIHVLTLLAGTIGSALARADLLEKLNAMALTDELTGLPNRRSWDEHFALALARARRSKQPLSVLVLDLNGFKGVNDVQGHAAGDRILRQAATAWSHVLRDTDVLARLGGDEFAVVLEDTDARTASAVAGRLANSISSSAVSVAVGLAEWDGTERGAVLLARADAAMYADKSARSAA